MDQVLIFAIIIIIVIFGIIMLICNQYQTENFSPTGWSINCPQPIPPAVGASVANGPLAYGVGKYKPFGVQSDGKNIIGTCGPGCVYKCKNKNNCPNLQVKGCRRNEKIPHYPNNQPLGWGGTMSGPYVGISGCASNVNGITKMSFKNANGQTTPYGNQMYGMCVKGAQNPFDENPYHTFRS